MLARILTIPFDPLLGRFDDTPLAEHLTGHEVTAVQDHFFCHDGRPYLALVVSYRPGEAQPVAAASERRSAAKGAKPGWRELLELADFPLFNALREWRTERSKQEGVPPYVLFTNRQLAEVVKRRPASLARLAEIDGIGRTKLDRYGEDLLALLGSAAPAEGTVTEEKSTVYAETETRKARDE